jgi:WD40 repeat protein/serine/threonine protein kinase/DNA-binding SARP family transcriptional activator
MLEIRLLGQFNIEIDGKPIEIPSRPAQSLLAYLVLNSGTAQRREKLAGMFWPDAAEANARSNLRHALWRIRKVLGTNPQTGQDYLNADDLTITFETHDECWIDTTILEQKSGESGSTDALMEVLSMYRGELLPGFYDEWVVLERERLQAIFERKMQTLLERLLEARRWPETLEWGERWIAQGHTPEPAYRALMMAHSGLGDRSSMVAVYHRCVDALRQELGVEPSEQTRELYERLFKGDIPPLTPSAGLSGQAIGPYRVVEKLGAGGMAEVYKAYQPRLDRYVALKFIRPDLSEAEDFRPRFEREAKLLAKLNHPNIVHIYDFGEQGRQPGAGQTSLCYLAMEYVAGGTLKEWLRSLWQAGRAMTSEQALAILQQISAALDYAHDQGIIHRDIKPANIMLTSDGRSLLADFGIAKLISRAGDTTQTGSTTGTPAYMSPEQISGGADKIGPASDVYSLGMVLYEMLTGQTAFSSDTPMGMMLKQVQELPPPPSSLNPDLPQAVDTVILKALAKEPAARYQRGGELAQALQAALAAPSPNPEATLLRGSWWPQWPDESPTPGEPPFKGLQYFDQADADLFFGRELLTAQLGARLSPSPWQGEGWGGGHFLAIVGASGSGKSSLVRAGLIPALRRGEPLSDGSLTPEDSTRWPIHVITPTAHPLESLAASLTHDSESVTATATLMDDLARDPRSLHLYARRLLGKIAGGQGSGGAGEISPPPLRPPAPPQLLLVVDQFEELFTLCRDEAERRAFVDNLLIAAGVPNSIENPKSKIEIRTIAVITLRADFYAHCAQYDHLREALARQQEYIGPMNTAELRRAIEEPARQGGWIFEPGLVDFLLEEVGTEPGALPLLSHALLETWQRRRGRTLTFGGYRESGGVRGAIAKTADRVWSQLGPEEQAIARNIFLRLTELGEGTQDTRRRVPRAELEALTTADRRPQTAEESNSEQPAVGGQPSAVASVLHTLANARLITTAEDSVEVAHEALIREWPLLRQWLDENREGLYLHRHLTEAAQAWAKLNRDPGELYRGARLAQASEWAQSHAEAMNALERDFLAASQELARQREAEREAQRQRELEAAQKLAETEQRRAEEQGQANRRLRQRALFLAGALVIAGILAVVAVVFGQQASQNEQQALAERATAEAEAHSRATAQTNAETQQREAERQARLSTSRELAAAAVKNLEVDPELSILLALQAVTTTYAVDGLALPEALDALHQALPASRVRLTLTGHTDVVYGGGFSPDDTRLVTADYNRVSKEGVARIWDAATGQMLFSRPGFILADFRKTDGGKHLPIANFGQVTTITMWDITTGQAMGVITMPVHIDLNEQVGISLSPDWTRLIVRHADGLVSVWDATVSATKSKALFNLVGHKEYVEDIDFSPDGTHLATVSYDGTARIWEAGTGKLLFTLTGHTNTVRGVAFSPDGRYLATFGDSMVRVWDAATGKELFYFNAGGGGGIEFSPDGLHLATVQDTTIKIWNLTPVLQTNLLSALNTDVTDAIKNQGLWLQGHTGGVLDITFNSNGTRLISTGFDGTARVWDISPAGAKEWLTLAGHDSFWDITDVAFSPDGIRLATASPDLTAKIWDAATGRELVTLVGHSEGLYEVTFSPDGTRLATASADHTARIWDARTGQELLTLTGHTDLVNDVAYSPDGAYLATAGEDHTAKIWDARTGQELLTLTAHGNFVESVAYSPDGTYLATGSGDDTAKIWDARTGQEIFTLTGYPDTVFDVAFSPDGTRLATASVDGIKVWQTATGEELFSLTRDQYAINEVAFSLDGTRLAGASSGSRVIVWDISGVLEDGTIQAQELLTLPSEGATVAFSPDGRLLATGNDSDTTGRVYLLHTDELLPLARSRLTRTWTPEECRQYLHRETCPAGP